MTKMRPNRLLLSALRCLRHVCIAFRHLFGALRQKSLLRKWLKNSLRAAVVLLTALVGRFAGRRWVILPFRLLRDFVISSRGHRLPFDVFAISVPGTRCLEPAIPLLYTRGSHWGCGWLDLFFFSSSGGWGKIKLELTTLPRIFIRVVCGFNSVAFATQR